MPKPTSPTNPHRKHREEMTVEDKYHNLKMSPAVQREWVDRILRDPPWLSTKDNEFIEKMDQWLSKGWKLSKAQAGYLERIYARTK